VITLANKRIPAANNFAAMLIVMLHISSNCGMSCMQDQMWDTPTQPTPTYPQQALNFLQALMARYGANPALLAVSLLNEPLVSSGG